MILWDCQDRTLEGIAAAISAGHRRIVVTLPTGGGKTLLMAEQTRRMAVPTILYTNRRMLREQTSDRMEAFGIEHGVRASGADPALLKDVQVSSIMTEESRVFRQGRWELHGAKLVHVDEAHNQTGNVAKKILDKHAEDGAVILLWTATPLDIDDLEPDHLLIGAVNSELRDCGAHVPCQTYAPDEPDLRHVKQVKVGEDLSDSENKKAIMRPGIFGRVFDSWQRLNPEQKPAILFGPDVSGSLWFAEQFWARGVSAAHIDSERIWINGEVLSSDAPENRKELASMSARGEVKIVCNRFVMREGIDWPWLYHGIMATVFGSLTSYLQSGGRLLRAHSSLDHVLLQDHGGNWHRHGSLNADREWRLGDSSHKVTSMREERLREKKEAEPIVCPECGKVRSGGAVCSCGHRCERKSRMVVQANGELKEAEGDIYRPRRIKQEPDTVKLWESMYHRAKNSRNKMTFRQAMGLFFYENHYYPPKHLPLMPTSEHDWFRKVCDVPIGDLRKKHQEARS